VLRVLEREKERARGGDVKKDRERPKERKRESEKGVLRKRDADSEKQQTCRSL
jgi:hypothetical protein